jgi:hypothetical protein
MMTHTGSLLVPELFQTWGAGGCIVASRSHLRSAVQKKRFIEIFVYVHTELVVHFFRSVWL